MKKFLAAFVCAAALCMAVPAAAETFTTADGVLSIDLPDNTWKEMTDSNKWFVLSDGGNMITFEHFSNGEKLPDITVADKHYVNVFQAVFSTQNEVFLITASVLDAEKIPEVCNAIISAKVLKYDTKMAIQQEETVSVSEFSIAAMDTTMYATAGVNVRAGYSTNDAIIGAVELGGSVRVIGSVQRNGADYGWYQVSYGSGTGYISSSFLSTTAPAVPEKSADEKKSDSGSTATFTGKAKTIYSSDGVAVSIYESTDGFWYDTAGAQYVWITTYEFTATATSKKYTVNQPQNSSSIVPTGDAFTVFWRNGNATQLTPYSDGYYYSSDWVRYYAAPDATYVGADGTTLFPTEPILDGGSGSSESTVFEHQLLEPTTQSYVNVTNTEGENAYVWYDASGTPYQNNGDGTFTDYYGNSYNLVW